METKTPLVLIVAGGTGGHLYPGIAVAQALMKKSDSDQAPLRVAFVVRTGDLGRGVLERERFEVYDIHGRGLPRQLSFKALMFPVALLRGLKEAVGLMKKTRPDFVVGMGGYLSFPVLLAAKWQGIPTLIHEQNVAPGLANKILGRAVGSIAVSFPESIEYFPVSRAWVSGLPIRDDMKPGNAQAARAHLGLNPDRRTVFVFGGSQGAHRLNEIVVETWRRLKSSAGSWQVIHITGRADESYVAEAYRGLGLASRVLAYSHEMPVLYAAADLVICRSGASTIAELLSVQRRAILIPFPHATANHQFYNAEILQKRGRGSIILEKDLTSERLGREITSLLSALPAFEASQSGEPAAGRLADFIWTRLKLL